MKKFLDNYLSIIGFISVILISNLFFREFFMNRGLSGKDALLIPVIALGSYTLGIVFSNPSSLKRKQERASGKDDD